MERVLKNIKRIRQQKGYSHEYVAHKLSISQAAYSKLEKNETKLTVERLYKLVDILEIPIAELLGIKIDNMNSQNLDSNPPKDKNLESLYLENQAKTEKIIELYEARLRDKDRLIARLENSKTNGNN